MLFLAVDRSGGPTNNNIYMLASVVPPGRSTTDVMFVRSTDGGLTFSAPHKVNDDPVNPNKWHWFGTFSVAPNGRLDAVWYDTRNAANNTDSQLFYSFSTDAGVTWSANVAVSNAFNPSQGYPNQSKIGDYITIVSDETGRQRGLFCHLQLQPEQRSARGRRLLRSGISRWARTLTDADGYANGHSDKHTYSHANGNRDRHGNSDADTNVHADPNGHVDTKAYSYAEGYSNPKGSPDSASKAVGSTVISGSWMT